MAIKIGVFKIHYMTNRIREFYFLLYNQIRLIFNRLYYWVKYAHRQYHSGYLKQAMNSRCVCSLSYINC